MTRGRKSLKISVGDTVRRAYELKPGFDKAYYPNWTDETFKVEKILTKLPRKVFKVSDASGTHLQRLYYPEEMQKIESDGLYRIEKVIKQRKTRNAGVEYLVKYLGYPSTYNQWIPAENLQRLQSP